MGDRSRHASCGHLNLSKCHGKAGEFPSEKRTCEQRRTQPRRFADLRARVSFRLEARFSNVDLGFRNGGNEHGKLTFQEVTCMGGAVARV